MRLVIFALGVAIGAALAMHLTYWHEEPTELVPDPYLEGLR